VRGENYDWVYCGGGGFLSRVFTLDEICPGHRHICHLAKFERNWTIRSRVKAIELIGLGRCSPYSIFEESVFEPLHTLRDPTYVHTKFGDDTLIGGGDMPPKRNLRKKRSRITTSLFLYDVDCAGVVNVDPFSRLGTYVCVIMHNFSEIKQSAAELWRFK